MGNAAQAGVQPVRVEERNRQQHHVGRAHDGRFDPVQLLVVGGERGVDLALEPEPLMLVEDVVDYRRLVAEVPELGLALDAGLCVVTGPLDPHDAVLAVAPHLRALSVAGVLIQALVRNRFVGPDTSGTAEGAAIGLLAITILWPASPLWLRMIAATSLSLMK